MSHVPGRAFVAESKVQVVWLFTAPTVVRLTMMKSLRNLGSPNAAR